MCILSAPHLFLALQPSAKCLSRLGCTSYKVGPSHMPWECETVTLLQICSVEMVSLHPGLHAKNLKTNKWWWRSGWLYWSEWHHHNCTFGTWKQQSMESCSGYEVGVTLRKQLLSPSTGHVTGCDPRWKACCIIHSSVNGFYQDHILWWPVQKYTVNPVYLKIW